MTTVDILRRAANLLEERGWHRIGLGRGTGGGPLSLMGALAEAAGMDEDDPNRLPPVYVQAYHAIREHLSMTESDDRTLVLWNLHPLRTEGEVITLLRSVVLAAQSRRPA